MKFVDLTRQEYDKLKKDAMLNDELAQILEYKILDYSIIKIANLMNMSQATVNRKVKLLKKKIRKVI